MSDPTWKRVKTARDELMADQEAQLRGIEKTKRKREALRRVMGKKTPLDPRSDPEADDEVFQWLQGLLSGGVPVRLTGRWRPGVIYGGITKDLNKSGILEPEGIDPDPHKDGSRTVWVPAWKHTGPKLKTFAWAISMVQSGGRIRTFNLNLGVDVIAMAQVARARSRPIGFARYIRERMTKRLASALAPFGLPTPEFFFWVEARNQQLAHLHGVIVMPDQPSIKIDRAIRAALKNAGGQWNPAEHERQLKIDTMTGPAGWARYMSKWRLLTRLELQDDNTVAATQGVRSRARDWYVTKRASGDLVSP